MKWTRVSDGLPAIDKPVYVRWLSGFNDRPVYSFGARLWEADGWLWGVQQYGTGVDPAEDASWNSIEADDEYRVTHWAEIIGPEHDFPDPDRATQGGIR